MVTAVVQRRCRMFRRRLARCKRAAEFEALVRDVLKEPVEVRADFAGVLAAHLTPPPSNPGPETGYARRQSWMRFKA